MNKEEVLVTKYTNSSPYFSVDLTHIPTGITVSKDMCKFNKRDVEPLYKELEQKIKNK